MRTPNVFGWTAIDAGPARDPKWLAVKDVRFAPAGAGIVSPQLAHMVDEMVNQTVTYTDEPLTEWRPPELDLSEGNCIDFALAKRAHLIAYGVDPEKLAVLVVMDEIARQQHALLLVDVGDDFLVLDSRNSLTLPQGQVQDYQPMLAYGETEEWAYGR